MRWQLSFRIEETGDYKYSLEFENHGDVNSAVAYARSVIENGIKPFCALRGLSLQSSEITPALNITSAGK